MTIDPKRGGVTMEELIKRLELLEKAIKVLEKRINFLYEERKKNMEINNGND